MTTVDRRRFLQGLAALPFGCVLDGRLKLANEHEPEDTGDGWQVGRPEDVGVDPQAVEEVFERFFSEHEFINARSLLIARRGVLIGEGYVRDRADRERLQHIKSASKSVTSLLTGIAIERGVLSGVDAMLGDLLDEAGEHGAPRSELTIAQLLSMRSGLDWENGIQTSQLMLDEPANSVAFMLDRPMARTPGVDTHYADCDPHLVGAAIARQANESLERLARRWLFDPLGISNLKWEHGRDGLDFAAYGLWLRPRDMARLGELCRLGGAWQARSVVSRSWIELGTTARVEIDGLPYGYYWWPREDFAEGAYMAAGHGGQYIHVLPNHELVIVQTALPYTPTPQLGISYELTEELIALIIAGLHD